LQVSVADNARGTGSKLHTHPNEQFNYVIQGTLIADIDGQVLRVPVGHLIHIPAGMVHSHVSSPEEDVIFVAAKDTRHGITGPPVDGKHDGPRTLPGFGTNSNNEWKIGADGLPQAQSPRVSRDKIRYVYDCAQLDHAAPGPFERTDLAADGSRPDVDHDGRHDRGREAAGGDDPGGERPHSEASSVSHRAFSGGARWRTEAELDGQTLLVESGSGLHIPAGLPHAVSAASEEGSLCVLVEDHGR
jgi:quercetin dioxygenase-like cupin family protein